MRELRFIGVHDDGEHLVVTDDTGDEYRLRIDDRLRAATRRDRPRVEQREIDPARVSARDVQALIRAGSTADEVAALTGWEPAKIARFEGPVLAEREHVATRAQSVRMRGANQAGAPETLAQRTAARLATRDVDSSTVSWDACRDSEGQWTVNAAFVAGGRERAATWWFDQAGMSVVAKNDEAKWLSEAEAPSGPVPGSTHRPTAVFDVEVEEERAERANRPDPDDLINSMREHSGAKQRGRGGRRKPRAAAPVEEALPFEADETPPAARGTHPKDAEGTAPDRPNAPETRETSETATKGLQDAPERGEQGASASAETSDDEAPTIEVPVTPPKDGSAPARGASEEATDVPADYRTGHVTHEPTPDTTSEGGVPEDSADAGTADSTESVEEPAGQPAGADPGKQSGKGKGAGKSKGRGKRGRASVPSWDDVMFGSSKRD